MESFPAKYNEQNENNIREKKFTILAENQVSSTKVSTNRAKLTTSCPSKEHKKKQQTTKVSLIMT